MSAATPLRPQTDAPQLLTVAETCDVLRISRWTFYRLVQRRQLKTIKLGSRRLVTATALQHLVARLEGDGVDL
jgi:excisionase family DNA binding protein